MFSDSQAKKSSVKKLRIILPVTKFLADDFFYRRNFMRTFFSDKVLKFNDYKNCLLNNEIILILQQRFKCEARNVYTEEINKIVLSSNE